MVLVRKLPRDALFFRDLRSLTFSDHFCERINWKRLYNLVLHGLPDFA